MALADTGRFRNVEEIKLALKREGHWAVPGILNGLGIRRQLLARCRASRDAAVGASVAETLSAPVRKLTWRERRELSKGSDTQAD